MVMEYDTLARKYAGDDYLGLKPQQILIKVLDSLNSFDSNMKECIIEGYLTLTDAQARAELIRDFSYFSPAKDLEGYFNNEFDEAIVKLREQISRAKSQANQK